MKKCLKCNQVFNDDSQFCTQCGGALSEAQALVCGSCGAPINGGERFCQSCGTEIVYEKQEQAAQPNEPVKFEFKYNKFDIYTITEVEADNNIFNIHQYKSYGGLLKYGRQQYKLDIYQISEVISKKTYNGTGIFWLIVGAAFLLGGEWMGLLAVAAGFIFLKSRYLYIYFNNGYIKIPENTDSGQTLENLKNYIGKYNPGCIKVMMDK